MFVSPKVRSACWSMQRIYSSVSRTYVSRAHPSASTQTIPISEAIVSVLDGIEERKITREKRWQRGADKRAVKGIKVCFMMFLSYWCFLVANVFVLFCKRKMAHTGIRTRQSNLLSI